MWLENRCVENKPLLLRLLCHKTMVTVNSLQQLPTKEEWSAVLCYDGFALYIWESAKFLHSTTTDLKEASSQRDQQNKITFSKQQQTTLHVQNLNLEQEAVAAFFFRFLRVALPGVIFSGITYIFRFLKQELSLQGLSSTCATLYSTKENRKIQEHTLYLKWSIWW